MKIDFDLLRKIASAGATAEVIIVMLEQQYEQGEAKRKRDREGKILARAGLGKRATTSDTKRQNGTVADDKERQEATLSDTPRARLYREGSAVIMNLGRSERAARAMIARWLKDTNDDDQLVTATILRARDLSVSDAVGWITATLKGKANGTAKRSRSLATAGDDLIARAESFERENDLATAIEPEPSGTFGQATRR